MRGCGVVSARSRLFIRRFSRSLPTIVRHTQSSKISGIFVPGVSSAAIRTVLGIYATCGKCYFPVVKFRPASIKTSSLFHVCRVGGLLSNRRPFITMNRIKVSLC